MKILLYFLLSINLFAVSLLNYNIYQRDGYIDLILSLDAPFDGKLKFLKQKDSLSILLIKNIYIENNSHEKLHSELVKYIDFEQYKKNNILIKIFSDKIIKMEAAKVVGDFGIRVRIKAKKSLPKEDNVVQKEELPINYIPTYNKDLSGSYIKVTIFLVIAFIVLLYFRLKIRKKLNPSKTTQSIGNIFFDGNSKDINILSTKHLDSNNKLILVSLFNKRYLLLVGSSNVLVDTIENLNDEDLSFEQILQDNEDNAMSYIQNETDNKLTSYTSKL